MNLFKQKVSNQQGIYAVKFCKNGEWRDVVIDDYFPVTDRMTPAFAQAS